MTWNGPELWRVNGFNPTNNRYFRVVASPVVAAGLIYVPTRVKPLMALRPGGRGDVSQSHRVWSFENGPDVPTPVSDGTYFYSVGDKGIMWCLDAKSGKQIWGGQRLRPGTYSSSPVLADGKIYVSNEDGVTTVVEAGPEFKILAENPLDDYCLSSPAISDGQIFIRTGRATVLHRAAPALISPPLNPPWFSQGTWPARPRESPATPIAWPGR